MYEFDKKRRLLKKIEYDYVFEKAKKIVTTEFIFLYRENTIGHARLGLALSKKLISKAHDRNRLKRLLRETFRTQNLPGIDIIVLARKGVGSIKNPIIYNKLSQVWVNLCVK